MRLPEVLTVAVSGVALAVVAVCGQTVPQAREPARSAPMSRGGLPYAQALVAHDDAGGSPCQLVLFTEDTVSWTSYDALFPPLPPPTGRR